MIVRQCHVKVAPDQWCFDCGTGVTQFVIRNIEWMSTSLPLSVAPITTLVALCTSCSEAKGSGEREAVFYSMPKDRI